MVPFSAELSLLVVIADPEEAKNLAGESPPPDSNPFGNVELKKSV